MGVLNWLRGAGHAVAKGVNWYDKKITQPLTNFAKNLPVIGNVVKAIEPIGTAVRKTTQWAEDALGGVPAGKRRSLPNSSDFSASVEGVKRLKTM